MFLCILGVDFFSLFFLRWALVSYSLAVGIGAFIRRLRLEIHLESRWAFTGQVLWLGAGIAKRQGRVCIVSYLGLGRSVFVSVADRVSRLVSGPRVLVSLLGLQQRTHAPAEVLHLVSEAGPLA